MMTTIYSGLAIGAIYSLLALGYNIVWVGAGVFNFAQAQLLMVATFAAYVGAHDLHIPLALVPLLGIVTGLAFGFVIERVAIAPVLGRAGGAELVTTLGAAIALDGIAGQLFGSDPRPVPFYGHNNIVTIVGGRIYPSDIATIGCAVGFALLIWVAKRRTLIGRAAVAAAEDRVAATLRGIPVKWIAAGSVAIGGGFIGAFGILVAQRTFAAANLGDLLAVKAFVVMAIGGFGSEAGAVVGGLAIGLIEAFGARYLNANYQDILVFGTLLVVLLVRPSGLFVGHRARTV